MPHGNHRKVQNRHGHLEQRLHFHGNFFDYANKAAFLKHHCLYLQTYNVNNAFKRANYFPELLAHTPFFPRAKIPPSSYCNTVYLDAESCKNFRCFVSNGEICNMETKNGVSLFSTPPVANREHLVVLTSEGLLFSALKDANFQHSSFSKGKDVIFAGFWVVETGIIRSVIAKSGHYEPPLVSLQNFVQLLEVNGYRFSDTVNFQYANRSVNSEVILQEVFTSCQLQDLRSNQPLPPPLYLERLVTTKRKIDLILTPKSKIIPISFISTLLANLKGEDLAQAKIQISSDDFVSIQSDLALANHIGSV